MRENAEAGQINILNLLAAALPGWRLVYPLNTESERLLALARGYGLFLVREPPNRRIPSPRRADPYPFWRIDASNER